MKLLEGITLWASVAFYSLSLMAYIVAVFFNREKWSNVAYRGIFIGFIFQLITITTRWIITGHPPAYGVYENSQNKSFALVLVFLIASKYFDKIKVFGFAVLILTLITLGHGITSGIQREALAAPYKSGWVFVHVGFGQLAYGSFALATLLSIGYLIKDKKIKSENLKENSIYTRIPDLKNLDELSLKFVGLGFVSLTGMIVSGAFWASSLWGAYFVWEPMQVWGLISWLAYGVLLHLRLTLGWKDRRAAWFTIAAMVTILIWLWGIGISLGVHTRIL